MALPHPPRPFLLVKCTGFRRLSFLKAFLHASGIRHRYVGRFRGFGRLAVQLYGIDPALDPVEDWIWLAALQRMAPAAWDEVDLITLEGVQKTPTSLKKTLRRKMGLRFCRIRYRKVTHTVTINPVHMPDAWRTETEWEMLSTCLHE
jgi:hypothetical protein